MNAAPSLLLRALAAAALMIGFYVLAIGIAGLLLFLPYAEWTWGGRIHLKLTAFCLIGAFIILGSILPRFDRFLPPGPLLGQGTHPRLFRCIEEVASATSQPMPAEVYLIPDVNAWVAQRGGMMGIGSRRVMGLGLPLLEVLAIPQFQAVLAHEFGHYHGGDTALGPWIYKTRAAIGRTIRGLAEQSSWLHKPFLWYGLLYLRITHAISRRQELSADQLSARIYGGPALAEGLRRIHGAAIAVGYYWGELVSVLEAGVLPPVAEGFGRFMSSPAVSSAVEKETAREMKEGEANPFDTHPPLRERLEAIAPLPGNETPADTPGAISLLEDLPELEMELLREAGPLRGDRPVRRLTWESVGAEVYVRRWIDAISRHAGDLAGITPASLPEVALDLDGLGQRLARTLQKSLPPDERRELALSTLGAALAVRLARLGWAVSRLPGEGPRLVMGGNVIEPFAVVRGLASRELPAEDWRRRCVALSIFGLDLGALRDGPEG